jgi:hypothetical protein
MERIYGLEEESEEEDTICSWGLRLGISNSDEILEWKKGEAWIPGHKKLIRPYFGAL